MSELNMLQVNGNIGQEKFWRYWLLCTVVNAITVCALVAGGAIGWKLVGG